jgi:hypothetical protein
MLGIQRRATDGFGLATQIEYDNAGASIGHARELALQSGEGFERGILQDSLERPFLPGQRLCRR